MPILQDTKRRAGRMPEAIPRADADHRQLRFQFLHQLRIDRVGAPVVSDLVHVDVADWLLLFDCMQHVCLGVSGQKRGIVTALHQQHDAGSVLIRLVHRIAWPKNVEREAAHVQAIARFKLADRCFRDVFGGFERWAILVESSRTESDYFDAHKPFQCSKTAIMIVVKVCDHDCV